MTIPLTLLDESQLQRLCEKYHVIKLALFGSVLGEQVTLDSDIDVLVAFREGHTPDFLTFYAFEEALSALLGNHPHISWRAMTGMRNRIVHDYLGIDEDVVCGRRHKNVFLNGFSSWHTSWMKHSAKVALQ